MNGIKSAGGISGCAGGSGSVNPSSQSKNLAITAKLSGDLK
jgi:hypothetical protein